MGRLLWLGALVAGAALLGAAPPPSELTEADATGVLSRMVRDDGGHNIGRIVDVVVDPSGHPRAIVVDVGGFMGVGTRRVAVAWNAVHVPPPGAKDKRVLVDLTDNQLRNAPAYTNRSKPATIVGPAAPPDPVGAAGSHAAGNGAPGHSPDEGTSRSAPD